MPAFPWQFECFALGSVRLALRKVTIQLGSHTGSAMPCVLRAVCKWLCCRAGNCSSSGHHEAELTELWGARGCVWSWPFPGPASADARKPLVNTRAQMF